MCFDNSRESSNVEDRRGGGGGLPVGGKGIGIGTIVLALVAMYFGVDPSVVLNQAVESPAPRASACTCARYGAGTATATSQPGCAPRPAISAFTKASLAARLPFIFQLPAASFFMLQFLLRVAHA